MSGFVVAAHLFDGVWTLRVLQRSVPDGLDPLLAELRAMRAEGVLLGLVSVDDDWAALVRPAPGGARLLVGDSTVALEDEDDPEVDGVRLVLDILDYLGVDAPTDDEIEDADDPDAPWPEGDFSVLADLGVGEQSLSVLFDDAEIYASDQLLSVAGDLGFGDELADLFDRELADLVGDE
ncbi:tRNA adenosine deaminase-associated protein [uncultured Corynebacterium sp.]|uniref:tRNA adenosine deaminase-associated protein n=1 Tax=uncultured Corynebacterium sp. TaxID=159447 RepID=UPI0025D41B36|nr:tRNA adenosine deaminase-associated protein [uncultured Corynebacterium sp.]